MVILARSQRVSIVVKGIDRRDTPFSKNQHVTVEGTDPDKNDSPTVWAVDAKVPSDKGCDVKGNETDWYRPATETGVFVKYIAGASPSELRLVKWALIDTRPRTSSCENIGEAVRETVKSM